MIEIEVQNETYQSQERLRFASVPRIGEGIRLRDSSGFWASFDVIDVWYQKAEYGDVWVPYVHVRLTPGESQAQSESTPEPEPAARPRADFQQQLQRVTSMRREVVPFAT